MKREGYLSWNDFFMNVALLCAQRSKDPDTQTGACIVNRKKRIVGTGYNGLPNKCSDEKFPWIRIGSFLETKYAYVVHAEVNAIMNSTIRDLTGCRMFTTLFPCNECAKLIIQSGINEIIYYDDKYHDRDFTIAARQMLDAAEIRYWQLKL